MRKITLIIFFISLLFGPFGCLSTSNFQTWNGQQEFFGQGGAFTTVDGVDIYSIGDPDKKYKVLGVINTSTMSAAELMLLFGNSWSTSTLIKEAKAKGANAIILVDEKSKQWTNLGTDGAGHYQTTTAAINYRMALLVKYVSDDQGGRANPNTSIRPTTSQNSGVLIKIEQRAEAGDPESQFALGCTYFWGWHGVEKNYTEAIKWFEKSAQKNYGDSKKLLAGAYSLRGASKLVENVDLSSALADCNKAIEINPDYLTYCSRGSVYTKLGELKLAKEDYSRSINIDPQICYAYYLRGMVQYCEHTFRESLSDFYKSVNSITNSAESRDYSRCFIWIIQMRLGDESFASKELRAYLDGRIDASSSWALLVLKYLADDITESELLKFSVLPEYSKKSGEAFFYIGAKHLVRGDKQNAKDFLNKCLTCGRADFTEFECARADLKILEQE